MRSAHYRPCRRRCRQQQRGHFVANRHAFILTLFLRYVFLWASRLVTEGCLISVSRRGAGSGGRGIRCIGDVVQPPAVQAAHCPGVPCRTPRPLTADRPVRLSETRQPSARASTVECHDWVLRDCVTNGRPPGTARSKPINTARGTPWDLADLRHYQRTSTSLDVARRRGPWVPWTPWRPARPRFSFGAGGLSADARRAKADGIGRRRTRRRSRIRAMALALARTGQARRAFSWRDPGKPGARCVG